MSNLVTIPNAVITFLNAGTFTKSFTAFKEYYPTNDIAFYKDLKVMVVLPAEKAMSIESRKWNAGMLQVSILVRQKIDKTNKTAIDGMMTFCDEIAEYLLAKTITGTKFICTAVIFNAMPDLANLEEFGMFTGAFTFSYKDLNIT